MLLVLINVLIIVVVGAVLFWVIDRFVRDGRLANLLKILIVLICLAAILQRVLVRSGRAALGGLREPFVMPCDGATVFGDLVGKLRRSASKRQVRPIRAVAPILLRLRSGYTRLPP